MAKRLLFGAVLVLTILCPRLNGQRLLVESDTQEGQLLQQIDAAQDGTARIALLEKFAKDFPNHEAVTWVLGHLQTDALEKKQYDRAIALAARILSLDPDDVAAAHNALKAAQGKHDVPLMARWSAQTAAICKRVEKSMKPEDREELKDWTAKVEYAKQVAVYSEYALYFAALNTSESAAKLKLIETLEKRNPKSEYLAQLRTSQAQAVRQVDIQEAVSSAEAQFRKGEFNPDLLLMVAEHYMQRRTAPEKVIAYANKVIELVSPAAAQPQGLTAAEWSAKRSYMLGLAHWMAGLLESVQERFAKADKHLRTALPLLTNPDMISGALYHLGYVNYRLANAGERIRIHDALKFTEECTRLSSIVQAQAIENLKSMKAEYGLP